MNSLEALRPVFRVTSRTAGIIIATRGVLYRNALAREIGIKILSCALTIDFGKPIKRSEMREIAPVAYIAAATGYSAATVITPVLLKPLNRPAAGASLSVIATVNVPMNTSQAGNFSDTSTANIAISKIRVIQAGIGTTILKIFSGSELVLMSWPIAA